MVSNLRLVKAILKTIASSENNIFIGQFYFGDDYTSDLITDHLDLIRRGGLITLISVLTGDSSNKGLELTYQGREYLDILYTCLD